MTFVAQLARQICCVRSSDAGAASDALIFAGAAEGLGLNGCRKVRNEKKGPWLFTVDIGDDILPNYMGIIS